MNTDMSQEHQNGRQTSATLMNRAAWLLVGLLLLLPTGIRAETLLLTGATVHTVTGETLAPGSVLIKEGKIVAVGATIPSDGAQVVDLAGQHLYPGLIALDTVLGL